MNEAQKKKHNAAIVFKKAIIKAHGNGTISFEQFGIYLDKINAKIEEIKNE